jgi:hypothetical protein
LILPLYKILEPRGAEQQSPEITIIREGSPVRAMHPAPPLQG